MNPRLGYLVVAAVDLRPCSVAESVHERGGLTYSARTHDRLFGICERSLRIAQEPQSIRSITQSRYARIVAETARGGTMLKRLVQPNRLI